MRWNISKDEIAKGKLVAPGWHPVEVVKFAEKMNKAGDAMNAVVTFKIIGGAFEGVEKVIYFSEKAPGVATGFLLACGAEETETGINADMSEATVMGKRMKASFIRGEYNNRPTNEIVEYAPLS